MKKFLILAFCAFTSAWVSKPGYVLEFYLTSKGEKLFTFDEAKKHCLALTEADCGGFQKYVFYGKDMYQLRRGSKLIKGNPSSHVWLRRKKGIIFVL